MHLTVTTVVLLILVPTLVWRIYSRLKLVFRRQESVAWRHGIGAAGLPILLLAAAQSMLGNLPALSMMAGAVIAGAWLAFFALRKTRFENTGVKLYFTPPSRTAILVCMLFAARVLQIGVEFYINRQSEHPRVIQQMEVLQDPLSVIPFGLVLGYLAAYSIGLLRWRKANKLQD
ncbi:hypothetical protein [Pseudoduganella violaceinigra]|uniref:hypothetical protein n=1 Tax=Pseudoduganella violaceinigra TaxID=246602 RepID=UPI0003FD4110|nr:hypothetical protein [Pseudoduganella violaceinigra]